MKMLIKQKFFWISLLCLLIAAGIAAADLLIHPSNGLADTFESAMNGDTAKFSKCCEEELAADFTEVYTEEGLADYTFAYTYIVLGGSIEETESEEWSGSFPAFVILKMADGTVEMVDTATFYTVDVNGKNYIGGVE